MRLEYTDPLAAFLLRSPLGLLVRGVAHLRASVRSKLLAAFLLVTLLFLLMGAFSVQTIRRMSQHTEALDAAVQKIEDRLRTMGEREVPTSKVGDLVMRELAKLDKVAYVRFASVYRSFETPEDFREALQEVKAKKRRK